MKRRAFVTGAVASGVTLVTPTVVNAQGTDATPEGAETTRTTVQNGYAPVNGLQMYYETHGEGEPLLPGTTHITVMNRIPWLVPMIEEFLNEPMPDAA